MILAIDIGNSNIVLGIFKDDKLSFVSRLSTDFRKTSDELAAMICQVLSLKGVAPADIVDSILSTVVPSLLQPMESAIETITGRKPLLVAPGIKTGLNVKIDNPSQLGSDMLTDCVAASNLYPKPVIVLDLGTATTVSAVDKDNNFIGGAIMPGVMTGLNALIERTAQLPQIAIEAPKHAISTNTNDSMQSGIVFGTAAMLDGMIERFEEELGCEAFVVATGGLSGEISKHTRKKVVHNPNLLIEGLYIIYKKNVRKA
ncbi:MAG: type III pantothenate kinase [Clostridia bacterium]|nr:type III pantothenate kinase [Clostridia bacterium]